MVEGRVVAAAAERIGLTGWQPIGRSRSLAVGICSNASGRVLAAVYDPPALHASGVFAAHIRQICDPIHAAVDKLNSDMFWPRSSGGIFLSSSSAAQSTTVRDDMGRLWVIESLPEGTITTLDAAFKGAGDDDWVGSGRLSGLAACLAAALIPLHQRGLAHLNLSPVTVAQGRDGQCGLLLPFPTEQSAMARSRRAESVGLDCWCAPELWDVTGRAPVGPAADIYAASALLYRATTGVAPPPWQERIDNDPVPDRLNGLLFLSREMREGIVRGLSIAPEDRPANASLWSQALGLGETVDRSATVMAPWLGGGRPWDLLQRPISVGGRKVPAGLVGAAAALLLIVGYSGYRYIGDAQAGGSERVAENEAAGAEGAIAILANGAQVSLDGLIGERFAIRGSADCASAFSARWQDRPPSDRLALQLHFGGTATAVITGAQTAGGEGAVPLWQRLDLDVTPANASETQKWQIRRAGDDAFDLRYAPDDSEPERLQQC